MSCLFGMSLRTARMFETFLWRNQHLQFLGILIHIQTASCGDVATRQERWCPRSAPIYPPGVPRGCAKPWPKKIRCAGQHDNFRPMLPLHERLAPFRVDSRRDLDLARRGAVASSLFRSSDAWRI